MMSTQVMKTTEHSLSAVVSAAPINFAHLSKFTLGNRELEREVLELFSAHALLYLGQLKTASGTRDWHIAAHTLKGSAAAVGACHVAELAARAEALKEDPDLLRRKLVIDQLEVAVAEAADHIAVHFPAR